MVRSKINLIRYLDYAAADVSKEWTRRDQFVNNIEIKKEWKAS
jgi:hypothetical protein